MCIAENYTLQNALDVLGRKKIGYYPNTSWGNSLLFLGVITCLGMPYYPSNSHLNKDLGLALA